jgi:glycosyltransferase involved in cell wall biosynthesis
MRIALIAPPWLAVPPPSYGGTEAVIDELARGLATAGHEVVLYTTGDSTCPVPKAWTYETAQTSRIGEAVVELRHLLFAYEWARDADVIHDHTVVGPVLAAARGDRRVVTTNHGPFDAELTPVYRSIAERIPVIAISHDQARTAGDIPIARIIHHGVDPTRFAVGQGRGGYVAFLGRMAPSKGIDIAISAAKRAGTPLLIAAKMRDQAEYDYFRQVIEPMLDADAEYVGELSRAGAVEFLGNASALLNPIRWHEPFGMVMIESLACGTPVIGFPHGSAPEIVEHGRTGYLCRDPDEMVVALGEIDSLDRGACRRSVEERFSTTRMVERHLELYTEVAARQRVRPGGQADPTPVTAA